MANGGQEQQSFTARAVNSMEGDIHDMTRGMFAEDSQGGPPSWVGMTHTMMTRLKSGKYGETIQDVLGKSLTSVRKDSPQYKLTAGDMKNMNQYERNVFNKMKNVVGQVMRGEIPDPTGGATHFENVQQYGMPSWAPSMDATTRIGSHTYFKEKSQPPPTLRGNEQLRQEGGGK